MKKIAKVGDLISWKFSNDDNYRSKVQTEYEMDRINFDDATIVDVKK